MSRPKVSKNKLTTEVKYKVQGYNKILNSYIAVKSIIYVKKKVFL